MDLFEPGSGSQVHDFNGAILPSGLFWTLPVADHALRLSHLGRRAVLDVRGLPVVDSFVFGGTSPVPATVSLHVEWEATAAPVRRGSGGAVPPTDPAAFLGEFAFARSTAAIVGLEFGFAFRSNPGVSTDRTFAEMGLERNGIFL